MTQAASVSGADAGSARARNGELANQLRAAAEDGDETRITRLLSELLRCKGLSRGQRIALQQKALLTLVQSLRSAALNDDLTGLHNRRAFTQIGTRVLDIAARDREAAHLVYFGVDHLERIYEGLGRAAGQIMIRQTGNLLRDLFPSYGVYEVLGRMDNDEFAALTTNDDFATRRAITERVNAVLRENSASLALSIGVAHFDPDCPVGIDELLESAKRDMNQPVGQPHIGAVAYRT